MQFEWVFIAIVSTVVTAVVATSIVVAALVAIVVGAFGRPLLGLLVPNVEVVIFDGIARCKSSVGTRPPQRMRAVLSTGSLSSHCIASSIDGSLASSFNSKLLGDTMAAARVQNIA
jgi:hypothetical protein